MKKLMTFFLAGALMSALSVACNSQNPNSPYESEQSNAISVHPVSALDLPEDISAFFEKYSQEYSDTGFQPKFPFGDFTLEDRAVCLMINSVKEFEHVAPPPAVLPFIDFDKYTLSIGLYAGTGGDILKDRYINIESDPMKLNLIIENTGKGLAVMFRGFYWDIYPKLPQKPITISVTNN
ncbi:MAG: hypothetical protein LBR57_02675 [Alistipes sp.]|jgi:hypothetical protein|nr:hypothetical protein [Alistipes sp.]